MLSTYKFRFVISRIYGILMLTLLSCFLVIGVAQLISKLNNKPFDESDETLFEVLKFFIYIFAS